MTLFSPDQLGLDEPTQYVAAEVRFQRSAAECSAAGDAAGTGWALLGAAWAMEKQGRGSEALNLAEAARAALRQANDLKRLAECCHSIGVWKFHHRDDDPPVADFTAAIEARLAIGDLMAAAQSWHNLGYVQLIAGRNADADSSYERAAELLGQVEGDLKATAFRQLGFVLSHQAYAAALYRPAPTRCVPRAGTSSTSFAPARTGNRSWPTWRRESPWPRRRRCPSPREVPCTRS